ncbi:trypsin [Pilimelia anulata]|uniref:Trypsin n=1 Tax=Pilimelia anulata TaxID=53371 RepID=A0A8J3F717_9ACTN|nr:serine protease [Pilimelia anulata]GGJ84943.1 trypsin [Pilimelia anulata]
MRLAALTAGLLAAVAAGAGPAHAAPPSGPAPTPAPRIVGGKPAAAGAYPWMAQVRIGFGGCGASLVSPDVLITASHCWLGSGGITARIGSLDHGKGGEQRTGVAFRRGDTGGRWDDWAVIKLDRPVAVAAHPALPADASTDTGPLFRTMGWGTIAEQGPTSPVLREVDVPYIADDICTRHGDATTLICAGDYERGGVDSCKGDSGGPLVNRVGDRWVLVGIVSKGNGCARPKEPGMYTRISHYREAIATAIREVGGTPPAVV